MGQLIRVEDALPWARRMGGGYPRIETLEEAVSLHGHAVYVGQPHPEHGYFACLKAIIDKERKVAMKRIVEIAADELEVGMLVQHPQWRGTARNGALEAINRDGETLELIVDGESPWRVHAEEFVQTFGQVERAHG